jgi:thiamine biosynthesis lipoprotein
VEKPGSSDHSAYAAVQIISVDNGAVTSSGTYRNRHVVNGKKYSHIIDPRTGYPVNNGMVAATVIAADAMTADAWDNVLVLAGPEKALKLLALYPGIEAYLVFTDSAGVMRDTATAGFGKYRVEVKEPAREHGYGDLQSHFPSGYPMSCLIFRR